MFLVAHACYLCDVSRRSSLMVVPLDRTGVIVLYCQALTMPYEPEQR
jgi:hypothetical protein